jgi:hypothetical protein
MVRWFNPSAFSTDCIGGATRAVIAADLMRATPLCMYVHRILVHRNIFQWPSLIKPWFQMFLR